MARAMASICNDEQRCFGVQGGHGQKTLSLSGALYNAGTPHRADRRPATILT